MGMDPVPPRGSVGLAWGWILPHVPAWPKVLVGMGWRQILPHAPAPGVCGDGMGTDPAPAPGVGGDGMGTAPAPAPGVGGDGDGSCPTLQPQGSVGMGWGRMLPQPGPRLPASPAPREPRPRYAPPLP